VRLLARFLLSAILLLAMNPLSYAADLSGDWSGCWESCKSGHNGPLHATFCKIDDKHYEVRFSGRFWRVFPFRYTVVLEVTGADKDKVLLSGTHHLRLFGTFHFQAEATDCRFTANYCSDRDRGTFQLTRCGK
jgi:hypothetical protein